MVDKLKILVVDDSRIFRSLIEKALGGETDVQVIGSVRNGVKAVEFIKSTPPDVVTLDVEMPEMDGLQTLRAIQEINASRSDAGHIGVIMVSAFTREGADVTIQALEKGAFDFITKPEGASAEENITVMRQQFLAKIRNFATRRGRRERGTTAFKPITTPLSKSLLERHGRLPYQCLPHEDMPSKQTRPSMSSASIMAVLIGVSTGGPKALMDMLPDLSDKIDMPIFIVQHMPPTFTQSLARSLDTRCRHTVIECCHGDIVRADHIYVARGGNHMLLRKNTQGEVVTAINEGPPENGCRPAVDVLFRSAAIVYGGNVVAIVLTGMGTDGTKGAGPLKRAGAYVIAQDEGSSVVWGMPGSIADAGLADEIAPLNGIPDAVRSVIQRRVGG